MTISSDDELVKIMKAHPSIDTDVDLCFLNKESKTLAL
jgi:hypothetical protein